MRTITAGVPLGPMSLARTSALSGTKTLTIPGRNTIQYAEHQRLRIRRRPHQNFNPYQPTCSDRQTLKFDAVKPELLRPSGVYQSCVGSSPCLFHRKNAGRWLLHEALFPEISGNHRVDRPVRSSEGHPESTASRRDSAQHN